VSQKNLRLRVAVARCGCALRSRPCAERPIRLILVHSKHLNLDQEFGVTAIPFLCTNPVNGPKGTTPPILASGQPPCPRGVWVREIQHPVAALWFLGYGPFCTVYAHRGGAWSVASGTWVIASCSPLGVANSKDIDIWHGQSRGRVQLQRLLLCQKRQHHQQGYVPPWDAPVELEAERYIEAERFMEEQ